jgi:putative restriction endonuclease
MVALFIANTDNAWFDFLADEPNLAEVNFWQPGGLSFRAIEPGEILAFRLKSPRNKIGGFGILSSSSVLPLQMAWETLGRSNGAPSYEAFRHAIAQLRNDVVGSTTNIGCRILVEPVFFPEHLWMALPPSWMRNIVGGKRYSTDQPEGLQLWNELQDQAQQLSSGGISEFDEPAARYGEPTSRYGEPRLITPRLGQGAFRIAVTEAYGRRCAVSEGKVLPALDAAHIRPYADGGVHTKSNGILLRKDIHCVFDAGYATVDADYKFVVSNKVKEVFDNGHEYRRLHGRSLLLPRKNADWPDLHFLRWHNEKRFLG